MHIRANLQHAVRLLHACALHSFDCSVALHVHIHHSGLTVQSKPAQRVNPYFKSKSIKPCQVHSPISERHESTVFRMSMRTTTAGDSYQHPHTHTTGKRTHTPTSSLSVSWNRFRCPREPVQDTHAHSFVVHAVQQSSILASGPIC